MSPASKSKSKDKKVSKDSQKAASKSSGPVNGGSSIPASAYNPLLGTFHTLELSASAASPIQTNGRFRNIDVATDENSGASLTAGVEYDAVSNNGSWSGESEGQKPSNPAFRQEIIPGADNDKREKIRLKNERKHQRQKERRAQELHEKCTGYLMTRKLEALAQQLVAMGFSQERATVALILNEGRVEESVAWLFEGGEEAEERRDENLSSGNLKIDISEELARIADMEIRYKCSRQEVERAIVVCEGDLDKTAESLRDLKLDSALPKPDEIGDSSTISNYNLSVAASQNLPQTKINPPTIQRRKNEKDFNYTKAGVIVGGSTESVSKNVQPLKTMQPKLEWAKLQQIMVPVEKRWPTTAGGSNPSVSYSLTSSSLHSSPPLPKAETRYVTIEGEFKNLQSGTVREPVIMVQRPQSVNAKQVPATSLSSSPPGGAASWCSTNGVEIMKPAGFMPQIQGTRSLNQMYHQLQHQQRPQFVPPNIAGDFPGNSRANISWNRSGGASPALSAASSLGLFSGLGSIGSSGSSSPIDWNTGSVSTQQLDYTNIDWSLNRSLPSEGGASGILQGFSSFVKNSVHIIDSSNASRVDPQPNLRSMTGSNLNGLSIVGLQEGGVSGTETSNGGVRVWASPFEEKDLFSLPRQFVSSPPL